MNDTTEATTALILSGQGYEIEIAPEALTRRAELIDASACITKVTSNDESAVAARHMRSLAALRIEVEKCRKTIKEPVLAVGKRIDQAAKAYLDDVEAEEARLKKLIGAHAEEVARLKRIKEEEERRAFEEARRAREEAERAAEAAASSGKIADVIAAKQAEKERREAMAARMDASAEVAGTKVADGVRFAWDFEVENEDTVYRTARDFVDLTVKRAAVLAWLKGIDEADADPVAQAAACGIRAFKKPVVSTR
jgi:regulator of protease activity HflC (stomatin/prohibitin superfamily)